MLEDLKQKVFEANLELVRQGLVIYTWGNVSGIDREKELVVIKPSGVDFAEMCGIEYVKINKQTNTYDFKQTLRNNEVYFMLNKALK